MTERVNKHGAAEILGVSPRTVVEMANRGELPSAAKIGRIWSFDKAALRAYVRKREMDSCRSGERLPKVAPGGATSSMAGRQLTARIDDGLFTQTIQKWRKENARRVKSA